MSSWLRKVSCCIAVLLLTSCSESSGPTTPTTPPPASPPVTTPQPPARGRVAVSIVPNPVPYSGERITDAASCATSTNTWFYDQIFTETGGSALTFTRRVDFFDNIRVSDRSELNIVVPANGSLTMRTRWCSVTSTEHSAESVFTGTDAAGNIMEASAGVVRLLGAPR